MSKLNVALLGYGTVGQSVAAILHQRHSLIKKRTGNHLNLTHVLVRSNKKRECPIQNVEFTTDPKYILNNPNIHIIIEVMGGEQPALDYIKAAIKKGKHVVTANKELVSKHKKTLFDLARKHNVDLFFEAAVGGGIPLIRSLKVGLSANRINAFYGIVNGTTNYILTKIQEEQRSFNEILKNAQDLGFAEADPSMDISGLDSAYKCDILAAVAFKLNVGVKNIQYSGIEDVSLNDIQYAEEIGYQIKLLAVGRRIKRNKIICRVGPTMIPKSHPLANVRNELNAIYTIGDFVGESMMLGKGAGGNPTASAIVSDVIDIAFEPKHISARNLETSLEDPVLASAEEIYTQMYIRLTLKDSHGTLEDIAKIFGKHKVSISKLIQKDSEGKFAELLIVTHLCAEKNIQKTVQELKKCSKVKSVNAQIRVGLDE